MRGFRAKSVDSTLVTGWLSPSVKTTSARRFALGVKKFSVGTAPRASSVVTFVPNEVDGGGRSMPTASRIVSRNTR